MASYLDILGNFLGANAPTLMTGSPTTGAGLYGIGMGGIKNKNPQVGVETTEGHEAGILGAGPQEKEKKSFWQSPGGSILGTLLTTLGTAGLGAGLGALSGGKRGAGQGAAAGGGLAFLNDLMQRRAASQIPANLAKQQQEQQELAYKQKLAESQGIPTSVKEYQYGLQVPGFAEQLKQQQTLKGMMTPYQQASLGLQQQALDIKKTVAGKGPTGRALPAKEADTLGEGMLMPDLLSTLKGSIEEHKDIMGPGAGRLARMNPYNTRGQAFQGDLDRVRQLVGKFMEGGVLRKEDEAKYEKILATLADTPETAYNKLEGLMGDISKKYNAHLSSLGKAGFDVSQYEPIKISGHEQKNVNGGSKSVPQQQSVPQGQFKESDVDAAIARKLAAAGK